MNGKIQIWGILSRDELMIDIYFNLMINIDFVEENEHYETIIKTCRVFSVKRRFFFPSLSNALYFDSHHRKKNFFKVCIQMYYFTVHYKFGGSEIRTLTPEQKSFPCELRNNVRLHMFNAVES